VDLEPGYARLELPFRKEFTHSGGIVQGDIITTLADSCIAHATYAALHGNNSNFTTIELKVNFIRPAQGNLFIAEAHLLHLGRRIAVGEAEIRNDDGKLVAKCSSSLMIMERPNRSDENPSTGGGTHDTG
ncbi:MAG: PaaI family thioesterase, partial [bacterium]